MVVIGFCFKTRSRTYVVFQLTLFNVTPESNMCKDNNLQKFLKLKLKVVDTILQKNFTTNGFEK